jgi:SAM-dependent methyltransferase
VRCKGETGKKKWRRYTRLSAKLHRVREAKKLECRICGNSANNRVFVAKEMMFGTRDEFKYFECAQCGCLQICSPPEEMSRYYPTDYYLTETATAHRMSKKDRALAIFVGSRFIADCGIAINIVGLLHSNSSLFSSLKKTNTTLNSKILEVGCGEGKLMLTLRNWGFKDVTGVDPYCHSKIDQDLVILKKNIHELPDDKKFDLIVFDHSFEHMPHQMATINKVSRLLSNNGACLLRIPVKTDYIWQRYGVDWVQLDAPRHFFLHTLKSLRLLAEESGLLIEDVIFDSTEFQFWGSEQYRRNIPLRAKNSYYINPKESIFTTRELNEFRKLAVELNKIYRGDQAQFYLRKGDNIMNV